MNKEFIKRLTLAHGWIGLVFSGLLFIIFFAGSIALFRQELYLWSMQPHAPVTNGSEITAEQALESAIANRDVDTKEHITIIFPSDTFYYYKAFVDIKDREGTDQEHYDLLFIDPITGEVISEGFKFNLGEFIYRLHYNLNIPNGKYVLGFVTLFFLFAIISGIFIHARKLISNFFQYRGDKHKRSQLLDMHNVVGVISIPFTLMYAISGLIFNLVIIYQIAVALTIYGGDQRALLQDAGVQFIEPEWQDKPTERVNIDGLIAKVTQEYQGVAPRMLTIHNFGDESSVIRLRSEDTSELTTDYDSTYSLVDESVVSKSDIENPNSITIGTGVLRKLHYADYASLSLRIVYFILGLAVCGLIVTGNLLWIQKREKQRNHSTRTLVVARYMTMVSSVGIIFATSIAFLCERLMPINLANRTDVLGQVFWIALAISAFIYILPSIQSHYKKAISATLLLSAGIIFTTLLTSMWLFGDTLIGWIANGNYIVLGVDIGLFISALLLAFVGVVILKKSAKVVEESPKELNNVSV